MSTVTKCSQVNCLNEGFTTFTPGRACSVSSVQGDRWRRFAKSSCPVCTHTHSSVFNDLGCSHLHRETSFAVYSAPRVHHARSLFHMAQWFSKFPIPHAVVRNQQVTFGCVASLLVKQPVFGSICATIV